MTANYSFVEKKRLIMRAERKLKMELVQEHSLEIVMTVFFLYFSVRIALLNRRLKAYKNLTKLMKGGNIEEHVGVLDGMVHEQVKVSKDLFQQIEKIKLDVAGLPHNLHLVRFNAFGNIGSDLSFALALVDDAGDGIVLSSIYGREESRIFAKPLRAGKSHYSLSEEETQAIKGAINKS